jgi:hypothetical protein
MRMLLSAETSARFVYNTVEPPSLVIHDGTTTLVLSPANIAGGLTEAAELAEELVQTASEWEAGCRRALAATQAKNPFDAQPPVAEYGRPEPSPGDGERA